MLAVRLHPNLVIVAALTLACDESLGPGDAAGTYVLRQVEQDPLPTTLSANEFFAVRVISDTIRMRSDGTGTISGVREAMPLQPGVPGDGAVYITSNIRFKAVGDQLEIEYECPDLALCVPPPHLIAQVLRDGLTARWGPSMSGRSPLVYEQGQTAPLTPR